MEANIKRFVLLAVFAALLAATTVHAGWWRAYEGEVGNCVQITSDGNYIISGRSSSNLVLYKVDTLGGVLWGHSYSRSDGIITRWVEETDDGGYIIAAWTPSLIKVDFQGDTDWTQSYGMYTYCVQETFDGGYIIVGGDNGAEADNYLILVKTDTQGEILWTKSYGELPRNRNSGFFIQQTPDSGYIITGITGIEEEEFATGYLWLMKTDPEGDTVWTREYGNGGIGEFNKGYCVRVTNDGGYVITGYKDYEGLWLLKTDAQGDTIWTKTYRTPSGGTGYSVQQTKDEGYILVGATETFTANLDAGSAKLWLLKTDLEGDTLWTRLYDANDWAVGRCVQQTVDLGYIVLGYSSLGIYLLKTDSLGLLAIKEEPSSQYSLSWEITSSVGPEITLSYENRPQGFQASVFDVSGREIARIQASSSSGALTWGGNRPSGVYFITVLDDKKLTNTKRIVLIH